MKVRRATVEDASEACAVMRRSIAELCHADHGGDEVFLGRWLSNKTVENVQSWIPRTQFFVAEEAGQILGVAAMDNSGRVNLNYVSPDARFRGVSKALMAALEDSARALGLNECRLETSKTALRFYRSIGYADEGQTRVFHLTGTTATVLTKKLRPADNPG
jgi:GNAT superfamily N-acetyltransferase